MKFFAVRPADLTNHVPEPIRKQGSAWRINPSRLKRNDGNLLRTKAARCSPVRRSIHCSFDDSSAATGTDEQRLRAFRNLREGIQQRLRMFQIVSGTQ